MMLVLVERITLYVSVMVVHEDVTVLANAVTTLLNVVTAVVLDMLRDRDMGTNVLVVSAEVMALTVVIDVGPPVCVKRPILSPKGSVNQISGCKIPFWSAMP